MPSKHVVRSFESSGYYHVFNRGVEKRTIFLDEQDYKIFLYYLSIYLLPLEQVLARHPQLPIRLYRKNLHFQVKLLSFCLMPNHFHLLLMQDSIDGVTKLLKQVTNAYTKYFNIKYKRVGCLFQGRFKAVKIENEDLLVHVARYIHLNPVVANLVQNTIDYHWSSYLEYLSNSNLTCTKELLLGYFSSVEEFNKFTLDQIDYAHKLEKIKHLTLDD